MQTPPAVCIATAAWANVCRSPRQMNNFCNGRIATARHLILGSFADLAPLYLYRFPKTGIENAVSAYETRAAGGEKVKAGECLRPVIRRGWARIYPSRQGSTGEAR